MPYYSAKQPQKAPSSVSENKRVVDNEPVTQIMTGVADCRLHLYWDDRIIIRKPHPGRIIAGFFSKGLTIFALWTGGNLVSFGLHPFGSGNALFHTVSASMISLAAMNLWWMAGPDELDLDLRQRTYQYRKGFLYLAPILKGTFNDILTVEVRPYRNSGHLNTRYPLVLIWNVPRRRPAYLGEFKTLEQAEEQQTRLLNKLAL